MNVLRVPMPPGPVIAAAAFNFIPIVGVLFWGWSAFALIFLYWLENLVIGARTLGAMAASALMAGGVSLVGFIVFAVFFTVHYGLFCFVHGTFVTAMFGGPALASESMFDLWGAAEGLFAREPGLSAGFASIVLWQVVGLAHFIARGEARAANPLTLMAAPYPRIIVLHLTIILGGMLVMLLNEPLLGLLLLALIKAGFDVAEAQGRGIKLGLGRKAASMEEQG